MAGIVTYKFRLNNATQFYESFTEAANINTRYYMFLARSNAWSNEAAPPTPTDTIQNSDFNIWRNMLGAKRVTGSDVRFAIPRYNWTTSTVYTPYSHRNASLYSSTFFVINSAYNVYKCMENNAGGASSVEPTSTGTSIFKTADGYHWKYMYNINTSDVLKFVTTDYIPVKTLTSDDSSIQWDIQQAAVNGAVEFIKLTANGSGYLATNGSFASIANSTTMALASHSSGTDDIYNYSSIYISGGLGSGQLRRIINYIGSSKTITVNGSFTTSPNTTSTYYVGPRVSVVGDGSSALAYANVTLPALASAGTGNTINEIIIVNRGTNYSKFEVVINANTSHGSAATANGAIAPIGGHGSDAVKELGGFNVMLSLKIDGDETGTLFTNNDFRVVGLTSNPVLESNGLEANSTVYDLTTKLTVTSKSAAHSGDEIITGGTSGAQGRYVTFANTNAAGTSGVVSVTGVTGTFAASETITGNTSSVTATVASINKRDLRNFEGDVLYVENRLPVSRSSDQSEDIKLIVRY